MSVTTVSHALNDKGRLHPETRARVRDVAQRLGYRPNPAARSLVSGHTGLIAVLATFPSGVHGHIGEFGYFTDLIGGATTVAVEHDVALVVAPAVGDRSTDAPFVWDRIPLDGLVVAGTMRGDPTLDALRARGIPFVAIGHDPDGGSDATDAVVETDEAVGMRAILAHLADAGARRPGLVTLPPVFASTAEAADAYASWCGQHDVEPAVATVEIVDLLRDRAATVDAAVADLLAAGVDAIHCPVEQLGIEALEALDRRGIGVPDMVRLSTTNDAGRAEIARVPLTTVDTDHAELGRLAVETLLDVLAGHRAPPFRLRVHASLTVRASTAAASGPDGARLG